MKPIIACGILLCVLFVSALAQTLPPPVTITLSIRVRTNTVAAFGTNFGGPNISWPSNFIKLTNGFHGSLAWTGTDDGYFIGVWSCQNSYPTLYYAGTNTTAPWPFPPPPTVIELGVGTNFVILTNPPGPSACYRGKSTDYVGYIDIQDKTNLDDLDWNSAYALLPWSGTSTDNFCLWFKRIQ